MRKTIHAISRFSVLCVAGFLITSGANASEGVKVAKNICSLNELQNLLRSAQFRGYDICQDMGNPSEEQNRCLQHHGDGSFEKGIKVMQDRKLYNAWSSGVIVQIDFAKEKVGEAALNCGEWIEVINSWSSNPQSGLVYPHRKAARKLVVKSGEVKFKN